MAREGVDDLVCADFVVEVDVLAMVEFGDAVFGDCNASFNGSADDEGLEGEFIGDFGSGDYGLAGFCDGGKFAHQRRGSAQLASLRGSLDSAGAAGPYALQQL